MIDAFSVFLHRNLSITSAAFSVWIFPSSEATCGILAHRQDVLSSIPSQHWLDNTRPPSSTLLVIFDALLEILWCFQGDFCGVYTKTSLFSSVVTLLGRATKH